MDVLISPEELKQLLQRKFPLLLVDVREPEEFALGHLPEALSIPLMELDCNLPMLKEKASTSIVLYCRSGERSKLAVNWLESQGLGGTKQLCGGINAYAKEIGEGLTPY